MWAGKAYSGNWITGNPALPDDTDKCLKGRPVQQNFDNGNAFYLIWDSQQSSHQSHVVTEHLKKIATVAKKKFKSLTFKIKSLIEWIKIKLKGFRSVEI